MQYNNTASVLPQMTGGLDNISICTHSLVVRASTSTVGLFVAVAITCSVAFLTNYSCIIIIINVGFYVHVLSLPNIVTNV